jgi:hypothetical protein
MFEDAFRAEHFLVALTKELDFLVLMDITSGECIGLSSAVSLSTSLSCCHGESSEHRIVDWQVFGNCVVGNLVKGTLDN